MKFQTPTKTQLNLIFDAFSTQSPTKGSFAVRSFVWLFWNARPTQDTPRTEAWSLHPGRLTWNLQIIHLERKMIFQTSMIMFHVNPQGCNDFSPGFRAISQCLSKKKMDANRTKISKCEVWRPLSQHVDIRPATVTKGSRRFRGFMLRSYRSRVCSNASPSSRLGDPPGVLKQSRPNGFPKHVEK